MSNNRDVEYDGDSYFFTDEKTNTVEDIQRDDKVALTFAGSKGIFGKPPLFIHVAGEAELIRDKARFEEHWVSGLDRWFQQGPRHPGPRADQGPRPPARLVGRRGERRDRALSGSGGVIIAE